MLLYSMFIGGGTTPGDTTAPTTSISSPTGGATVSGTTTISASASDNVGVSKVDFYLGTSLLGSDTTSPYSFDWNTTTVANGGYSLTTKAYDAAGNVGTSSAAEGLRGPDRSHLLLRHRGLLAGDQLLHRRHRADHHPVVARLEA